MIANRDCAHDRNWPALITRIKDVLAIVALLRDRFGFETDLVHLGCPVSLVLEDATEGQIQRTLALLSRSLGEPRILWNVQGDLSHLCANQAQTPLAIFYGKWPVNTLQALRRAASSAEQATQQTLLQSKEIDHERLADRLIAEARPPEAKRVLQMLKGQAYFDTASDSPCAEGREIGGSRRVGPAQGR